MKQSALKQIARVRAWKRREAGFCPVCGSDTWFSYNRHNSEDVDCLRCLSFSRNRAIALEILRCVGKPNCRSLRDLARHNTADLYVMAAWDGVAAMLRKSPGVVCSEFWDDVPLGTEKNGVRCEDARKLTFPGSSFDFVVSECVFEHIPEYRKAFAEVHRVLRPGGAHLFTIPYHPDVPTTERYALHEGEWVPVLPVELHSDRLRGTIPAYTTFGYDLPDILSEMGFDTRIVTTPEDKAERCCVYDGRVFVAVKRG